jgi:hypothetical protein
MSSNNSVQNSFTTNKNEEVAKCSDKRSAADRRSQESEGYTYITTVGWICRREKCRREKDKDTVIDL